MGDEPILDNAHGEGALARKPPISLLHVLCVGRELDASTIVESLGLDLVDNAARLVADVASVVLEPHHLNLRDHDLLGVAPRAMRHGEFKHIEHAVRLWTSSRTLV